MANEKISQLPAASTSSNGDLYPLVQGGVNKSITFTALQTAIGTSMGGISSLTGDVSASGPGAAVATVNFVGGQSAANVASATTGFFAATSANTPSTLVKRDASGNFSAGTITASLNGNASTATTAVTSTNFSGSLLGDVTGTQSSTVVSFVDGYAATAVGASVALTQAATSIDSPDTLVFRDGSGNFSAGTITANLTGNVSGTAGNVTATSNSTLITLSALSLPTSQLSGAVSISHGGTGATTAVAAFINLSPLTTAGDIIYENNSPAPARLPIGSTGQVLTVIGGLPSWANSSSAGVTSVALSDGSTTPIYSISGSPVTSTGTLTFTLDTQSANTVFAGPSSGSAAQPTFRPLVSADIPNNAANTTGTASNITASSNSTLTTLTALSLLGSQVSGNISGSAANVTGTVVIANGGTGQTTKQAAFDSLSPLGTAGDTLYYNGTHNVALGIGTTGQILTVVGGEPAWAAAPATGVTSVALADGSTMPIYAITGSPVTGSGTLTFTLSTQSANKVFAGPTSGGAAQPTFRLLVSADIPNNAANTTGTAANITASSNSTLTSLPNLTSATSLAIAGSQVGGFTQGSVIFAGAGGTLTQDNANFYWDDTNKALGIGIIPATNTVVDIVNNSGVSKAIQLTGYGSNVGIRGRYANGTLSSPTAATTANILEFISARGYGTSQFAAGSTGSINFVAAATFTNTSNPTYITFSVTPVSSVTSAVAMTIAPTGNVLIGTTTDNGVNKLQVNGSVSFGVSAGTSLNTINGALDYTVNTVSSNYTVDSTTTDYYIFCDTSGGAFTVTLPAPTAGRTLFIVDVKGFFNTNQLTLAPHGSEKISGLAANRLLYSNWDTYRVFSNSTDWFLQ